MRLIDADALKAVIEKEADGLETLTFQLAAAACINHIEEAPTIETICVEKKEEPKVLRRCATCRYNILDDPIMCNPCQHYDHWAERKTPTDGREEKK